MLLRMMLLVPLLRQFMLLDVGIMPDGSEGYVESPFEELDGLTSLHARAMLHMNKLGWPVGSLHRIPIGERWVPGERWFNRGHYETIYEDHFGASSFAGLLIMRSGAVYGRVRVQRRSDAHRYDIAQLDFATIDAQTRSHLVEAFEYILDIVPTPVYIRD